MEWVETTGTTTEDAKEAALDQLGVDEHDAEFEILEEARTGLFGRVRNEARVRARVRPTAPRAKEDRRDRRRRRPQEPGSDAPATVPVPESEVEAVPSVPKVATSRAGAPGPRRPGQLLPDTGGRAVALPDAEPAPDDAADAPSPRRNRGRRASAPAPGGLRESPRRGTTVSEDNRGERPTVDVPLAEQGRIAEEFLRGLLQQFNLQADISVTQADDDNVELALSGGDLGLLIGPKGATLMAIQDLTRTVVQRKTAAGNGRVHVDVSGYRRQRTEALGRFAAGLAEQVRSTGERRALEPMGAADRKVVHDALTDVEGVETFSEGEDPTRRVIIAPATS